MSTIVSKEKLEKVTVLLPADTVSKLDLMAEKALMGSRGRVIQSMVDGLWDSQPDIQTILNVSRTFRNTPDRKVEDMVGFLFLLLFPLGNVISRINKYLGVTETSVTSQPSPQTPKSP